MAKSKKKFTKVLNHPYNTRNKLNSNVAIAEEQSIESSQLCFDNWEIIASHLDLPDLISLSDVCTSARHAARLAFKRKYPQQKFNLWINDSEIEIWTDIWLLNSNCYWRFYEKGLKCLRFLRNFGDLMFKLKIDTCQLSDNANKCLRKGVQYVRKFGAECPKKLILRNYLPILLRYRFKNVDKIEVHTSDYSATEFNGLVENVPNLTIRCSGARKYLNQNMSRIKRLKIKCLQYNGAITISEADVQRAMLLNPQIEELISITSPGKSFKMKLNGSHIEILAEGIFNLPLANRPDEYDSMFLEITNYQSYSVVLSFVKKFKNLKCLTMRWNGYMIQELIQTMPMLENFQICIEVDEFKEVTDIFLLNLVLWSAAIRRNLRILSFHFKYIGFREALKKKVENIRLFHPESWLVAMNDVGPKEYKFSLVLNRIQINLAGMKLGDILSK